MGVMTQTCSFCHGSGVAERIEERSEDRDWVHNTMLTFEMAEKWLSEPSVKDGHVGHGVYLRIATVDCPRCGGAREYEVEYTPCKIF